MRKITRDKRFKKEIRKFFTIRELRVLHHLCCWFTDRDVDFGVMATGAVLPEPDAEEVLRVENKLSRYLKRIKCVK
jgi:hypothetical protein